MSYIQKEEYPAALQLLKRAEYISEKNNFQKSTTYNNLACYYRRRKKVKEALVYLHKALLIENNPDTRLNICAVLSHAGRHEQALESAMSSVILLQN
mmetsp:Transcript_22637/g.3734  ORF Transcript_22637/g.3734 Transcript_22637/m.3734 type:complete len:97 (+) Transcript_22637:125-415(+)